MAPAGVKTEFATFAAGCFWSVELTFQRTPGVVKTAAGYTQGHVDNPSYEEVCDKTTGHAEAVLVEYNPNKISYEKLLSVFWKECAPSATQLQPGYQYRSGIYFHSPEQEKLAKLSLEQQAARRGRKAQIEILPAKKFFPAEEYHQQYLSKMGR